MRTRWHKYKAKSSKCINGHYHASKLEGGYCTQLEMLKRNGDIKDYEIQKKFDLIVNDQKICSMYVDFWVQDKHGEWEAHETKGMALPVWNLKRKLFEALYPNIQYIVIR